MPPTAARLKRLPKASGLKRLSTLPGAKRKQTTTFDMPSLPQAIDLTDDQEDILARALDDEKLAKRVRKLQDQFPVGSVPELIVYDWLKRNSIPFQYQVALFGGRAISGGLVPDFILQGSNAGTVWQIQGDYWHTRPGKQEADMTAKLRMIGSTWAGQRIHSVIFLWEGNLVDRAMRDKTLRLALGGIEMPRR